MDFQDVNQLLTECLTSKKHVICLLSKFRTKAYLTKNKVFIRLGQCPSCSHTRKAVIVFNPSSPYQHLQVKCLNCYWHKKPGWHNLLRLIHINALVYQGLPQVESTNKIVDILYQHTQASDYKLPFGQYRGKLLHQVPPNRLLFYLDRVDDPENTADCRNKILNHLSPPSLPLPDWTKQL